MPRINTYSDNASIENDDKMLTYDTQGAATKLTAFSAIWNWIVSKLHALTSSSAALTPSTDRVLMDKNGTMTRVEPAAVAKYGIETYNGSTIAGSAQTVKAALDALNSKNPIKSLMFELNANTSKTITGDVDYGTFLISAQISNLGGYAEIINTTTLNVAKRTVFSASDSSFTNAIQISKASGTLTITNGSANKALIRIMRLDYYDNISIT